MSQTVKKAVQIISNVLLYVFITLSVLGVTVTLVSKKDKDGTINIFGKQMRIVLSASMEKCEDTDVSGFKVKSIPIKSMVFIDTVPKSEAEAKAFYDSLRVGDVLTIKYVYVRQETITHRITEIKEKPGGYLITLEGDNKSGDSETMTQVIDTTERNSVNYIIGRVTGHSLLFGLFISLLKSPAGIVCIIIIPAMAILVSEVFRIARILGEDKRNKDKEERDRQQNELEELKRRLAELEGLKAAMPSEAAMPNAGASPPGEAAVSNAGVSFLGETARSDSGASVSNEAPNV